MDGIIDKDNNPFRKDTWIEQGYSFTPDRQDSFQYCLSEVFRKLGLLSVLFSLEK
jgi:hypothetical protein